MSKKSKKRNKQYAGWDAKSDDSNVTVHKVVAVNRSAVGQWLHDHKKPVRIIGIILGVIVAVILSFVIKI
jgi:hypothetical protein